MPIFCIEVNNSIEIAGFDSSGDQIQAHCTRGYKLALLHSGCKLNSKSGGFMYGNGQLVLRRY